MGFIVRYNLLYFCYAGVLYRDAGDITLAVNAYEQCLKIDPDSRNAGQVCYIFGELFFHPVLLCSVNKAFAYFYPYGKNLSCVKELIYSLCETEYNVGY